MFMRCAYFLGKPLAGRDAEFHASLQGIMQRYWGFEKIRAVQLLSAREHEEGAPPVYATLQLCFDNEADLQEALTSPYRQALRAQFAETVLPLFEGQVKHINHAVEALQARPRH